MIPALQYPKGKGLSNLLLTASSVLKIPSDFIFEMTSETFLVDSSPLKLN